MHLIKINLSLQSGNEFVVGAKDLCGKVFLAGCIVKANFTVK